MSSTIKVATPTLVVCLVATATSAQAIRCNGSYQVVNGHEISTPYCRDNALAAVARAHGFDVFGFHHQKQPDKEKRDLPLDR